MIITQEQSDLFGWPVGHVLLSTKDGVMTATQEMTYIMSQGNAIQKKNTGWDNHQAVLDDLDLNALNKPTKQDVLDMLGARLGENLDKIPPQIKTRIEDIATDVAAKSLDETILHMKNLQEDALGWK